MLNIWNTLMAAHQIFASCSKLAILPVLILALSLSSCALDEDLTWGENHTYDFSGPKKTYYTSISLDMPGGMSTRDTESTWQQSYQDPNFVDGDLETENKISNLVLIFYNKDGEYITHIETDKLKSSHVTKEDLLEDQDNDEKEDEAGEGAEDGENEDVTGGEGTGDTDSEDDNIDWDVFEDVKWTKIYTIPVTIYETINPEEITSYFAIVNCDETLLGKLKDSTNPDKLITLDEMETSLVSGFLSSQKGFLMTTAAHYDNHGEFQWYDKRSDNNKLIYEYVSEARRNPIKINVERVASRVDLSLDTSGIQAIEVVHGVNIYELTFVPQSWTIEAQERSGYLVKHQKVYDEAHGQNAFPKDFETWVNYNGIRTFWAESPSFMDCSYPSKGEKSELSNTKIKLGYNTFEDISGTLGDQKEDGVLYKTGYGYFFEHTFNFLELTKASTKNPYAVPSSLVILGQYSAKYTGHDIAAGNQYEHPDPEEEEEKEEENGDKESGELEPKAYAVNPTPVLPAFTKAGTGFYIRNINFERDNTTQGDLGNTTSKEENDKKIPVYDKLKYRLYIRESETKDELRDSLIREQFVVFRFDTESKKYLPIKKGKSTEDFSEIFEIANTHTRFFNGDWTDASNTYTLQLKANFADIWDANYREKNGDLYYAVYDYEGKDGVYIRLTDDDGKKIDKNLEEANRQLQVQLDYATYYDQGLAFFYTPIPHYSGNNDPFYDKGTNSYSYSGLFNYTKSNDEEGNVTYTPYHKTSDFGMVRNHIYNIGIAGISKLGYGKPEGKDHIPLPDPRFDDMIYQFNIDLKVLPWYIVDYPNINIGGSNNN